MSIGAPILQNSSSDNGKHGAPKLPVEIIEHILELLWEFPTSPPQPGSIPPPDTYQSGAMPPLKTSSPLYTLPTSERMSLMRTLPLVSHFFLDTFVRTSLKKVYIPSPAYGVWFRTRALGIGFKWPGTFDKNGPDTTLIDTLCESITFVLDSSVVPVPQEHEDNPHPPHPHSEDRSPAPSTHLTRSSSPWPTPPRTSSGGTFDECFSSSASMSSTLSLIGISEKLPKLRTLRVEIVDFSFDDVLGEWRLVDRVPKQVEVLDVEYIVSQPIIPSGLVAPDPSDTPHPHPSSVHAPLNGGDGGDNLYTHEPFISYKTEQEVHLDQRELRSSTPRQSDPFSLLSSYSFQLPGIKVLRLAGPMRWHLVQQYLEVCDSVERVWVGPGLEVLPARYEKQGGGAPSSDSSVVSLL